MICLCKVLSLGAVLLGLDFKAYNTLPLPKAWSFGLLAAFVRSQCALVHVSGVQKLSAPSSTQMATALLQASSFPAGAGRADATTILFATAQDLYDRLMQYGKTGHMLVGREDEHWAPLRLLGWVWRYMLQTEIMGRGLDGIVVGLEGGMVVKVNKLHPKELKKCSTEQARRRMEAESEERFKKEIDYLWKHQNCPFIVPALPVVYVEGENSQRLGYVMPELKSADKFEWPNFPLALQVTRQLLSILCFFRKREVVYSDFKPENVLLQEISGGRFEVKLNDFGFVGTVEGEFKGGTDYYMHWDYLSAKRYGGARPKYPPLDYRLDAFAVRCIVFDMWGCTAVRLQVGSEMHRLKWRSATRELLELEGLQLNGLKPNERDMLEEVGLRLF